MTDDQLREVLTGLYQQHGQLTPAIVVDAARDPASPLHGEFVWDVNVAAERHWLDRARQILRRVPVWRPVEHRRALRVPAFIRDPAAADRQQGYVPIASLPRRSASAQRVINDELERVLGALKRARGVAVQLGCDDVSSRLEELEASASELKAALLVRPQAA